MKKNFFNKSIFFIIAAGMALSPLSSINAAASTVLPNVTVADDLMNNEKTVKVDGISYTITSSPSESTPGTAIVSYNKNCAKADVVIPDTINYYNKTYYVTEIIDGAFNSNHTIETLKLGKNIEKISAYSFLDCIKLKTISMDENNKFFSVVNNVLLSKNKDKVIYCPPAYELNSYTVPKTVTEIGDYAFYANKTLYEVTLNSSLLSIGNCAFANCISLANVNTSNSVEKIGDYAFTQTAIKNILLSKSLKELGEGAFLGSKLNSVIVPSGVKEIKANTFYNCLNLKSVRLYNSIEQIGDYSFADTPLSSFTMPDELRSIGFGAFGDCKDLKKINSNSKLKTIKSYAFYNCDSLLEFSVPTATIEIGDNVFTGCNHITSFKVAINNDSFVDKDGILYTKGYAKLIRYPVGKIDSVYTVPETTSEIAENALADCRYILSYQTEYTNKSFSAVDDVLYDYDKTILYAYPPAKIGNNFTIPDYVTKIMPRAFANSILKGTLNLTTYIDDIGEGAFDNCTGISEFKIIGNNEKFTVIDGILFSKNEDTLICYPNAKADKTYTLPQSVKSVSPSAFKNSKLEEITFNEGLVDIGEEAFSKTAIKEAALPQSLKDIGDSAFEASSIKSITIPASVSSIGNLAFANCPELRSVKFESPEILESPGYNIFLNTKLEKIIVPNILKNDYAHLFTITEGQKFENITSE